MRFLIAFSLCVISHAAIATDWNYRNSRDEMRGFAIHQAIILSHETPKGTLALVLRRDGSKQSVTLRAVPGHFICNGTISARFDEGPVSSFPCAYTAEYNPSWIFVNSEKRFIASLRVSKKLIIEASFFGEGSRQFTFDTSGLEW
jgi:hypothetical protein